MNPTTICQNYQMRGWNLLPSFVTKLAYSYSNVFKIFSHSRSQSDHLNRDSSVLCRIRASNLTKKP